jgi:hypothetical protein
MINNKDGTKLFKVLNPQILKFLKKYYKVVNKDNIYDIRNDIFINLYKNHEKLPNDVNEINKYIYITCKNYVVNYSRIKKKQSFIEYTDDNTIIDNYDAGINNIENDYINNEYYTYKISKMNRLKQDIVNYKNMGYSLNEISTLTNNSKTNIYRTFNNIKNNQSI